jgi:hypothetical protein
MPELTLSVTLVAIQPGSVSMTSFGHTRSAAVAVVTPTSVGAVSSDHGVVSTDKQTALMARVREVARQVEGNVVVFAKMLHDSWSRQSAWTTLMETSLLQSPAVKAPHEPSFSPKFAYRISMMT